MQLGSYAMQTGNGRQLRWILSTHPHKILKDRTFQSPLNLRVQRAAYRASNKQTLNNSEDITNMLNRKGAS